MVASLVNPHSRKSEKRRFVKDRYPVLFFCITPSVAVANVRAEEGSLQAGIDYDEFVCKCGKCGKPIYGEDECRFFEWQGKRGNIHNGNRKIAHKRCVAKDEAVKVSSETAEQIILRERGEPS